MATRTEPYGRRRRGAGLGGFSFLEVVAGRLAEAQDEDGTPQVGDTFLEYRMAIPEGDGREMNFDDFPFQREWYSEEVANAEEVVLPKSAQVGATAWGWVGAVRETDLGATTLYIFPTADHVREFGDERIAPAIELSAYLRSKIATAYVKTKTLKRIGRGFLYLRGSNSKGGAQSVPAQVIFFDEYDLLDQTNLAHIERRLSGARQIGKVPKTRRLGYPFTPNAGIDAEWMSSDQRVWHVTCSHCGDQQPVVWEENFRWTVPGQLDEHGFEKVMRPGDDDFDDRKVVGDVWRQCRSCEASFEDVSKTTKDGVLRTGEWIAQNPGSRIIGFHAWRGMVPTTDMRALVVGSRATKELEREAFTVLDLGLPYVQGDARLSEEDLLRACAMGIPQTEFYGGMNPTTMGVDVAGERDLNVVIHEQLPPDVPGQPNPRQALWIGTCRSFEEVRELVNRFGCVAVAVDSNPERRLAKALRLEFPGRVVLVEYDARFDSDPIKLTLDDVGVPLKVRVNRTDAIDGMMDAIRQCRDRPVQKPPPGWSAQMKALVRKTELDTKGRPFRHYVTTGSDGDDYGHAHAFGLVATELWRSFGMAGLRIEQAQGQPLADEALGIRRLNLQHDRHEG